MQRYNINNRLAYLSGGVQSAGGMWPSVAAADWWDVAGETCLAAYQPKGAASLAASYTNLANPGTYDAAPGVAPTWASGTGWTFNGTAQYLLCSGLTSINGAYTIIARFSNATNDGYLIGNIKGGGERVALAPRRGTGTSARYLNLTIVDVSPAMSSGVMAIAGNKGYRDGAEDATVSPISGSYTATLPIAIGAVDISGTISAFCAANIQAAAIYSTTLDATQISDLTTAMNAL